MLPAIIIGCGYKAAPAPAPGIASLSALSTAALRERTYGSTIEPIESAGSQAHESWLAAYDSDGLRVYTRIELPLSRQPTEGFPVVIFLHGWVGVERAPAFDFYFGKHRDYEQMIDAYVDAGFVVFVPGFRGHGTVDGVRADGLEYLQAYDNGSYLSPVFYAIDVLNLVDSLHTFDTAPLDLSNVNIVGHSQGGDVALITLAVSGEGSRLDTRINAASIWAGTFAPRFTQAETYHPMESSPEAFLSGDGTWTGTAVGTNGAVNPHFVFAYPADWIETVNPDEWTWQEEVWSKPHVYQAIEFKFRQMYDTVNEYAADIEDAEFLLAVGDGNVFEIQHDQRVAAAMADIGAFHLQEFLTETLVLQHSDRDFYSFPDWNADLCARVNDTGGTCFDFEYPGNTHALRVSDKEWFSPPTATVGFDRALARDIAVFGARTLPDFVPD